MKASSASVVASRTDDTPALSTGKSDGKPVNAKAAAAKKPPAAQAASAKPAVRVAEITPSETPELERLDVEQAEAGSGTSGMAVAEASPEPLQVGEAPAPVPSAASGDPDTEILASTEEPPLSDPSEDRNPEPVESSASTVVGAVGRSAGDAGGRFQAPAPRPLAKAETFVEGDHVVYPTHGVGKVERIAVEDIAGHRLELIHITFEENRMTLRVPVAKARSAGLRKLATRKMFDEALGVLKGRARIKRTMWSRRAQEYEAKINSGDPLAIAEVVRDLHRNAGQPDQSFSERQIYEQAMDRLAAELAALDQTDKTAAATKLAEFLNTVG